MTIDDLAGRLGTVAGEVEGVRAELERSQPAPVTGLPSREALERIRLAWIEQRDLAARVVEQIRRLAGDVAQAAQTYRAVDEPGPDRGWSP
ncbi:MAG TPA: hypothetical protein VFC19_53660 [Candidatus Limnocylindrales bacterium]|nr:hypothetical protein [Candidatus Limnocylindrales bacterium]